MSTTYFHQHEGARNTKTPSSGSHDHEVIAAVESIRLNEAEPRDTTIAAFTRCDVFSLSLTPEECSVPSPGANFTCSPGGDSV